MPCCSTNNKAVNKHCLKNNNINIDIFLLTVLSIIIQDVILIK